MLEAGRANPAPLRKRVAAFDAAFEAGGVTTDHADLQTWEGWVDGPPGSEVTQVEARVRPASATRERKEAEADRLAARRSIFGVDVGLDEFVMAFELTFMNLCRVLMRAYLRVEMETYTMVGSVLTLAGERITTASTETVRIYRRPCDSRAMVAVGYACAALTTPRLRRVAAPAAGRSE